MLKDNIKELLVRVYNKEDDALIEYAEYLLYYTNKYVLDPGLKRSIDLYALSLIEDLYEKGHKDAKEIIDDYYEEDRYEGDY